MGLDLHRFNPEEVAPPPGGSFSRVVTAQGPMRLVLISGATAGDDPDHQPVAEGDYAKQYVAVMSSLDKQLRAAGASWADVVYRRVFTLDVDALVAAIRDPQTPKWGEPGNAPGSTLIGVTRLAHPEFLLEVDLLAITEPTT